MGRASRAKEERKVAVVEDRIVPRGKKYRYDGRIVGWELHPGPGVTLPVVPNEAPAPLEPFELEPDRD